MFRPRYVLFIALLLALLFFRVSFYPAKSQDATPITTTSTITTSAITTSAVTTATTMVTGTKSTIKVGSKEFTEQLLLGKMLVLLLKDAGYGVEDKTGIGGSPAVRAALESGEIDVYPEYTGTSLTLFNKLPVAALPNGPDRVYELTKSLDAAKELIWLAPAKFNDTYTLIVRDDLWGKNIKTIADLASYMKANDSPLKICIESEFYGREQDGLAGLQKRYDFSFKQDNVLFMDLNETYDSLRTSKCDVSEAYSTDARINAWGFHNLDDTLNFFPVYNPAPVIRKAVLDANPELADLLGKFGQYLDNETMSKLNARVDLGADGKSGSGDEESVESVAASFLNSQHLLKPPTIVVASKDYTEQSILGKMLVLILKNAGYEVEDKTGLGGSRIVREAQEKGQIDVYVELTGSSLAVHNALPADALPSDPDKAYALAKSLDERKGLIWLDRGAFNDTYAVMVRDDLWNQNIKKIDDLAAYMNKNSSPLTICVENDFFARDHDGLPAMEKRYGFSFKQENVLLMDLDEAYKGLREKKCDVAEGYSTDGRGTAWGFHNLADTLAFFPFYNPAPVIRKAVLDANPELKDILNGFASLLDDTTMSQLNARADIGADGVTGSGDEESPELIARDFLVKAKLISPTLQLDDGKTTTAAVSAGQSVTATKTTTATKQLTETTPTVTATQAVTTATPLIVGSTDGHEQVLLGKLLVLLLENAGYKVDDKTGAGAPTVVRTMVEKSALDLYLESTGNALALYHNVPNAKLPGKSSDAYEQIKTLDAAAGLVWLAPTTVNRTATLLTKQETVEKGIKTLAELAKYMKANKASLTLCAESDFLKPKEGGLARVEAAYDFKFDLSNILVVSADRVYTSLREGRCDIAEGLSTDGRITAWDFYPLEDTLKALPDDTVAPVVRQAVLKQHPELATALDSLSKALNTSTVAELNARVDLGPDHELASGDEESALAVAKSFLCDQKLIKQCSTTAAASASNSITGTAALTTTPVATTTVITTTATPTTTPTSETSALSSTATAPADSTAKVTVSTPATYGVNARTSASTDAPIVQLLPHSTVLHAIGRTADNSWLQIELADGQTAWIFTAAVLASEGSILTLPLVTPPALTQ